MAPLDWLIVATVLAVMVWGVLIARGYMKSVADFLAANRTAGRYVLTLSGGIAGFGAITMIANLEMNYVAGFAMSWWGFTMGIVVLVVTVSGWVVYRFRQTRCLTLAEFFERRYSRRFRLFAGFIAFAAGIVNFGIFPAVGARFFIAYCGLPASVSLAGVEIGSFPLTMALLLGLALFFVFSGGQVAVIVTDFMQGLFVNVVFVVIAVYLVAVIGWDRIFEGLAAAPQDASLINPFKTSHVEDFNLWYHLIGLVGYVYVVNSWQGTQAYNSSATNAHEARMAAVLTNWRDFPRNLVLVLVPIVAYTVLHHADLADQAARVVAALEGVDNEEVRSQLRAPLVLTTLLPRGLIGAFAAVMLVAFITTHDTYLHSWGSIFVQDVLMPFRRKPLTERQHLRYLRGSILGVAVFIFLFSLLFRQSQYIFLFFAITGAIFAGGSGAVIIGGLYWRRGTTPAAWAAMITGSSIAVGGIVIHRIRDDFFINGQMFWALAMAASVLVYVLVSLLGPRRHFDLDRLLHRGPYDTAGEGVVAAGRPSLITRLWGVGKEFTRGDRLICLATLVWTSTLLIVFAVGTVYNLRREVADAAWARFWTIYMYVQLALALVVIVWFSLGGLRDLLRMFRALRTMKRDPTDDGRVRPESP